MKDVSNGVPAPDKPEIVIPRTKSDEITKPMHMIDHRITRQDGPPDFDDEATTTEVVDVERAS